MVKKEVFIGSSGLGLSYAQCFAKILNSKKEYHALDWATFFSVEAGGKINLQALNDALGKCDIGVFFITHDYWINFKEIQRGKISPSNASIGGAKPNVWFELGLFMGRLGMERSIFLMESKDALGNVLGLTDLAGIQPYTYNLEETHKEAILKHGIECSSKKKLLSFSDLPIAQQDAMEKALKGVYNNHFTPSKRRFEKGLDSAYTAQSFFRTRESCYQKAREIIDKSENRLYTIISYEDEMQKPGGGLWPSIRKRINREKRRKNGYTRKHYHSMFKRYLNFSVPEIFEQAKLIAREFGDYIEIKDTYCKYLEVVISDDEVLIVLPNQINSKERVENGIYIHNREVANEFADWLINHVPEPNGIVLSDTKVLNSYASHSWKIETMRNGKERDGCGACKKAPPKIIGELRLKGLIP